MGTDVAIGRFDYKLNTIFTATIRGETMPIFIIPVQGCKNQFAVGLAHSVKIIGWDGVSPEAFVIRTAFELETDSQYAANHMHRARADPKKRFFGSTFRSATCNTSTAASGAFYRYTKRGGVKRILGNINVASGLDWNVKEKKFYCVDACNYQVREYDWKPKTGAICKNSFDYYSSFT